MADQLDRIACFGIAVHLPLKGGGWQRKSQREGGEGWGCAWRWLKHLGLEILMFLGGQTVTLYAKKNLFAEKTQLVDSNGC
jgi:hypothetical protein